MACFKNLKRKNDSVTKMRRVRTPKILVLPDENERYWRMLLKHALEDFDYVGFDPFAEPDVERIRKTWGYLTAASKNLMSYGLDFLANERYREADRLFELSELAARKAIETQDYDKGWFPEVCRPYTAHENQFIAAWLRTGTFDKALGKQLAECTWSIMKQVDVLEWMMWANVLIEDFERAKFAYREFASKPIQMPPIGISYVRNEKAVLYLIAEYATGNKVAMAPAKRALYKWFHRCHIWHENPIGTELPVPAMLKGYLYGRHFTGKIHPRDIMLDIRGNAY